MFNEDETEQEETEVTRDPHRWSWTTFFSILVASVGAWFNLIAIVWAQVSDQMDKHKDWKDEQAEFRQRASLEIEALTKELASAEKT